MPPLPSKSPRRRNAPPLKTPLPREGRKGRCPRWPLEDDASPVELKLWRELWHSPQAVQWELLGYTRMVARYVRRLLDAEKVDAPAVVNREVRQLEDRLGLSPVAMLRLRWEISDDVEAKAAAVVAMPDLPDRWRNAAAG